jgi:hypothetical protein
LIAVAAAVAIGLLAGLVVVIALDGSDDRAPAVASSGGGGVSTAPDPVETLGAHFELLEQGRFLAASDDLTPELLDSLGGSTFWVAERIADLLIDAQLDASVAEETTARPPYGSTRCAPNRWPAAAPISAAPTPWSAPATAG